MPLSEFDIIERYFNRQTLQRDDVKLGIGDDAALITPPAGQQLVVAIDTLVEGVHFPLDTDAEAIGWKALAVNLSDLAAMGAEPAWFTLALTLPHSDEEWLAGFSRGLSELADKAGVQLVGGDTTRGPLTVTIQVAGYVPAGEALLRRGAKPGEEIWVSGSVGDAALALQIQQQSVDITPADKQSLMHRLDQPEPRYRLGVALRHLASSCIDVSDGLIADLAHLCAMSRVGASLDYEAVPLSSAARQAIAIHSEYRELPLYGGDDYELCFTAPGERHEELELLGQQLECPLSCIGVITAELQLQCRDRNGEILALAKQGYQHFGDTNT